MARPIRTDIIWLRTLACFAVASVHLATDWHASASAFSIVANQLARFGTPSFVFITAFLLESHYDPARFNWRRFLTDRFLYLLVPYLVVSLYWNGRFLAAGDLKDYSWSLLVGACGYLYFIPILFQFFLLYLWRHRVGRDLDWTRLFILSCGLSVAWVSTFLALGVSNDRWQWLFPLWTPYFALGGLFATRYDRVYRLWNRLGAWRHFLLATIAGVVVSLAFWYNSLPLDASRHETLTSSRSPQMLIFSVVFIAWFMLRPWKDHAPPRIVSLFASRSYGIYLLHPLVAGIVVSAWPGINDQPNPLRFACFMGLSLVAVILVGCLPGGHLLVGKPGPVPPSEGLSRLGFRHLLGKRIEAQSDSGL